MWVDLNKILWNSFQEFETLAKGGAVGRLNKSPIKYSFAQLYRRVYFPIFKRSIILECKLFWGEPFFVWLPSGLDIFLTGGKAHPSEIRLAKYLMVHCKPHWCCIDVGAHFGYYSRVLAKLATEGVVYAIEPSSHAFEILKRNTERISNIYSFNLAMGEEEGQEEFFEYPIQFSEYNSAFDEQYKKESWRRNLQVKKKMVEMTTLDVFCKSQSIKPDFIKIDVEGGEFSLLSGASGLLQEDVIFAMEFLSKERGNEAHRQTHALFLNKGFAAYRITEEGNLELIKDVEEYISSLGLESDNLIYRRSSK